MIDRPLQLAYAAAHRALRLWWRLRKSDHKGALAAIWCGDCVLAVRPSYQRIWTFPGGGVKRGESPMAAASRELREETGVWLPASSLKAALVTRHFWHHRWDEVHLFEARLVERPRVDVDRREIVEARWVTAADLAGLPIAPHLRDYLARLGR